MAWLSVLGLYNYNEDLFKNMVIPENVDRKVLIDTIIYDNAELGLIYADHEVMTDLIGVWSKSELDIWDRLNKAFNEEYNPLWNVDEDTTETRNINREGNDTRNDNRNIGFNGTNSSDTVNKKAGYNSNVLENDNSSNTNIKDNNTTTDNLKSTGTNKENIIEVFNRKRGGNIGVTMSQQLLEAELETRPKLNIYKYISNSFKERFCLMIY